MGKHARIVGEIGLPMRRLIFTASDGSEQERFVYDTSDPAVQDWVSRGVQVINCSSGRADELALLEAVQYRFPEEPADA